MYIVLEGIDGSGKTSLLQALRPERPGYLFVREPGGTDQGELLRSWLETGPSNHSPSTAWLIYMLSRSILQDTLKCQANVVSDRSLVSALAYPSAFNIEDHYRIMTSLEFKIPDLVIYLYTPPEYARQRSVLRGDTDVPSLEYFTALDNGYKAALAFLKNKTRVAQVPNLSFDTALESLKVLIPSL